MSAYISLEQQFTDAFNLQHGTTLTWADLEVRSLVTPDFTYPASYRSNNTLVTLGYKDKVLNIAYDRIPVTDVLAIPEGLKFALPKTANGSSKQLAPYLGRVLGIDFTERDFVDNQYVLDSNLSSITLTIASTSLRWVAGGTISLTLPWRYRLRNGQCEMMPITLSLSPDQWATDNIKYTQLDGNRASTHLLTASCDYTPVAHLLRAIVPIDGYTNDARLIKNDNGFDGALAAAIGSVDGVPWVIKTAASAFNLWGAWPLYNGPVSGARGWFLRTYTTDTADIVGARELINPKFTHVLVLRLQESICTNLVCNTLVLHYNEV